jgi:hypothetical protein
LFDPREVGRLMIDGRAVIDAVDAVATVARPARYRDLSTVRYGAAAGQPVFAGEARVEQGVLHARLSIELAHTPQLFPQASQAVRDDVRTAILAEAPAMAADVAAARATFDVDCRPPGSTALLKKLSRVWEIK